MTLRDRVFGRSWASHRVPAAVAVAFCLGATSCTLCDPIPPSVSSQPPGVGTAKFLDASDFSGEYDPRPAQNPLGGKAIYEGRIVFSNLSRSKVELVLPQDLRLANNTSSTPDVHPVALIFGHQTHTAWVLPDGFEPEVGQDYSELILVIPFVQRLDSAKWHNYVARIYLDDFWAMVIGNWWFGLQKLDAGFTETTSSFNVAETGGAPLFALAVSDTGAWIPSSTAKSTLKNYQDMLTIFEMPVIGTHELAPPEDHICSYFEWHLDQVQVRPIVTGHKFVQALAAGMETWVGMEIPSVEDGAFEIQGIEWLLRLPPLECNY